MAVTTDIWTSCANDAYLSLTMHFVDSSWDMISCILATALFPEYHTVVNIVDKVKQVMEDMILRLIVYWQLFMISVQTCG